MNQLTQEQLRQKEETARSIRYAYQELVDAVETFNDDMRDAWKAVVAAQKKLNDTFEEAEAWLTERADAMAAYAEDQMRTNPTWVESGRGRLHREWQEAYETVDFEYATLSMPEGIDYADLRELDDQEEAIADLPDAITDIINPAA